MLAKALQCLVQKRLPASVCAPLVWKAVYFAGWGKPSRRSSYHFFDNSLQCLCGEYCWFNASEPGALINDAHVVREQCEKCRRARQARLGNG